MNNRLYCKILALCVVLSFIGIGIQPAFGVDIRQSISNNQSEECRECRELSNAELIKVKQLINRVETYSKLLLVLSKNNPELKEKSDDFYNQISTIQEMNDDRIICDILQYLVNDFYDIAQMFADKFIDNKRLIGLISLSIAFLIGAVVLSIVDIMELLNCEIKYPWPPR